MFWTFRLFCPNLELILVNYSKDDILKFEKEIKEKCLVGDLPIFDKANFEWVEILEDNHKQILEEYNRFVETIPTEQLPNIHELSEEQRPLSSDEKWKFIPLFFFNEINIATTLLMPRTTSIVNSIPVITTCFFSILHPGKYIQPHRGYYAGVLRCHLALKVPKDSSNCWISIDKIKYCWEVGKTIVFDDTYEHEVYNNTNETRVVLFIDFIRPLPEALANKNREIIEFFQHSEFVKNPISNYEKWEKKNLPSNHY
jgi:aspartyl/asparaginyl beta-hydroxylase (cupin superfamily)